MHEDGCIIGRRSREYQLAAPVVLSRDDRRRHIHVIGKTGTGKTNLLKTLIFDDLMNGLDFALIDPLGGLASAVVDAVPPERNDSTIYWDPGGDLEHVVGFNPLDRIPVDHRHLVADHVLNAFLHVWGNGLEDTPRLAYVLYSGLRLLLDNPGSTLLGLPRLLTDDDYRQALLAHCTDVVVRGYFENEFGRYDDRFRAQVIGPIQTRVGMLLSPPVLRNIIGQPRSTICIAKLMNERGSLICNFSKGLLGATGAHLLGAFVATAIAQVAEERTAIRPELRRDFTLYADEVQNISTSAFAGVLSEARQQNLSLVVAHQYLAQIPTQVRDSLFGNCGTQIVFRIGAADGAMFGPELELERSTALAQTPNFSAWCKLLADGQPSEPFLLATDIPGSPAVRRKAAVIAHTRARHTRPRATVEAAIARQMAE